MKKPGRNDPCLCGSGKKYKHCCGLLQDKESPAELASDANTPVQELLQRGLGYHQAGHLPQAEAVYRQILQTAPNQPDALHLLGMVANQRGQNEIAVDLIGKAISINPVSPMYYNLGNVFHEQGKLDAAVDCFQKALKLQPEYVNAYLNLGIALKIQGKLDASAENFRKVLKLRPDFIGAHLHLGNVCKEQGKLDDAIECFQNALKLKPDYIEAHINLGNALKEQGKLDEAVESFRKALELKPDYAEAHNNLGNALQAQGKLDAAVESFRKALELKPDYAEVYNNLGNVLKEQGRLDEAIDSFEKALALKPDYAEAHNNLGAALHGQGKLDKAIDSFEKALALKPDYAEAHNNLGAALHGQGKLDKAIDSFEKALALKPDYAEAHNNLGAALHGQGKLDKAIDSFEKALALKPDYAEAHNNLGAVLHGQGKLDKAIDSFEKALALRPDYAEAHCNLGGVLQAFGRLAEAEASQWQALALKPDHAEAHCNLGSLLTWQDRLAEAEASLRRALVLKPDFAEAHCNLAVTLMHLGRLDEAAASFRRALEIKPNFAEAYGNLLFLCGYHALTEPLEYLAQARNWEWCHLPAHDRQVARDRILSRLPLAGRRLRVGYVSGDYHQHAVSYFIEQLFAHHDRARIELFAYSTHVKRDAVTERLQAMAEHWVSFVGISDAAIRERIESDGIDVLIDLSGHTAGNRLGVFARRAAPVQAHYLGYFASTGLTEMDYWIGDEILTPPETDSHFSERAWRLPRVWVSYDGKVDAPSPAWHPTRDGTVWLGSFNNLGKLTSATLALWAKVLHALPEGKLLLKTKALGDPGNRQRILDALSGLGISSERIELQDGNATPDWSAHMAYYNRLDIALDPVGAVGGGTTTCDALWMGVPVVAREGDRMASRMTASMLNAIGRPEWIARSEAEYIDKVVTLARDVEQRKALRSSQRNRMASSPLCDARDLAISLENAYFEMFERWLDEKN